MASKRIELRDNHGNLVKYIDNIITSASWEWDRIGGCGGADFTVRENFDGAIAGSFAEDYEVRIYLPNAAGSDELWYSGFIDRVQPQITGEGEQIQLLCLGYINQLKRIIIEDKTYSGWEISNIAKDIIDTYVAPNATIYSTTANFDDSGFTADSLYFNESAYDVMLKLAQIAGKREWGVRADKAFFFRRRDDSIKRYYHIKENFSSFQPVKDFNPIITRIYLEGGEGYKGIFTVTNRITLREQIIQNSSITTQSVGQQYARMFLKENGIPQRSYQGVRPSLSARLEATHPLGRAAINMKIGINYKYDVASQLYDSGLKYDGGTEVYQINKIKYQLLDDKLSATLHFGPLPTTLSDEFKQLEFALTNERNI